MLRWKSSLKPAAAAANDYRSTILAENPLFYYRLGETSGATALDEVTSSNNGTYYNTPSLGQTGAISGDSNTSVLFEQANAEYAKTVTLSSETSLLPCTIECFIKLSGASDDNAGIVFYRSGSYTASGLNIRGTTLGKLGYHWANDSNTYFYSGGPTLSDNTWYYVALVVESTKATFYVIEEDGTLTTAVNSVSHSALNCSNDGWLIARDQNVRYFQGYLDEVAIYDQALSQSTLVAHAAAAGYAAASGNPGTTNLVSNWSMDETSGTRVDSHGSNDLTDNNTVGYATGVISNAASFTAANGESLSSSTQPVTGTGARAAELWFKTSSTADIAITSYGQNASGAWWRIRIENGVIWQRVASGAISWSNTWNDGNWHHLVMQVAASSTLNDVVLYIDGTLQTHSTSNTRAINTGSGNFYIGAESSGTPFFDGDIDEVRYWNRVLTAEEITWLYNSGSGRAYSDL